VIVNAAGPFVDELNHSWGVSHRSPHRVLEGHPPGGAAAHHRRPPARARVLRRHAAAVLRDPDGHAVGHRHHRHARRRAVHRGRRRPTALPARADQRSRLDLRQPLTKDDIIAERCGVRPLVVNTGGGDQREVDWTSLSRKHAIETDRRSRLVTVFGGKLTDCLNVGEEVAEAVESLGVPLERDLHNWYGEPAKATRAEFYRQAKLMKPRLAAHQARRRAAERSPVAALRPPRVLDARSDPRRSAHGRGHHGERRLPARRAAPRGQHRDDHQARGLHAPPVEDRAGGSATTTSGRRPASTRSRASCSATTPSAACGSTSTPEAHGHRRHREVATTGRRLEGWNLNQRPASPEISGGPDLDGVAGSGSSSRR
jgi:hypothetical protein